MVSSDARRRSYVLDGPPGCFYGLKEGALRQSNVIYASVCDDGPSKLLGAVVLFLFVAIRTRRD
jgi:hypothetical protein